MPKQKLVIIIIAFIVLALILGYGFYAKEKVIKQIKYGNGEKIIQQENKQHFVPAEPMTSITALIKDGDWDSLGKRLDLLKSIGVNYVRVDIAWADVEPFENNWDFSFYDKYFSIVAQHGLKIRPIIAFHYVPVWYYEKYPDAYFENERGEKEREVIGRSYHLGNSIEEIYPSIWHPQTKAYIQRFTKKAFEELFSKHRDHIDSYLLSLGRWGENQYPDWTHFWMYDPNAQSDFRLKMREKYNNLETLNKAWGKNYRSWDEVIVPKPETEPGQYWEDVLGWYRDTKRKYAAQVIDMTQQYTSKPLVNGPVGWDAISPKNWDDAVNSGGGNDIIRAMFDNYWFLDEISQQGMYAQYTGFTTLPFLMDISNKHAKELMDYYKEKNYTFPFYGENVGEERINPIDIAKDIVAYNYDGFDYVGDSFVFDAFGIPNKKFYDLAKAFEIIRQAK